MAANLSPEDLAHELAKALKLAELDFIEHRVEALANIAIDNEASQRFMRELGRLHSDVAATNMTISILDMAHMMRADRELYTKARKEILK